MSGFKLLAIRPLEGCDKQFLKNLKPGMVYKFYQDYDYFVGEEKLTESNYENFKGHPITDVKFTGNDIDLYSKPNGLNINISAVVGKNGSGKSALMELFFLGVYTYYFKNVVAFEENKDFNSKSFIKQNESIRDFCKRIKEIQKVFDNQPLLEEIKLLTEKDILMEVYYSIDETERIFSLQINLDEPLKIINLKNPESIETSEIPFYSIVTNYSIFGLNPNVLGDWLKSIFNKNDAYQLPIVINPKREYGGNIDVESESSIQTNRLLLNIIDSSGKEFDKIVLNQKATKSIIFSNYKHRNFPNVEEDLETFKNNIIEEFDLQSEDKMSVADKIAFNYIAYKIEKTHRIHTYLFNADKYYFSDQEYLKQINKNKNHITLKIHQSINFIRNTSIIKDEINKLISKDKINTNFIPFEEATQIKFEIKENDLSKILFTGVRIKNEDKIYFAPPPILEWDIKFSDNEKDSFNNMSSGEKQLIYVIQTVVYHIRNILSSEIGKRENINLVFDEIELYFHPDYQRQFIKKLIDSLNLFFGESKLKINILFLTHSPFILSDIPSNNILCLEDGKVKEKLEETFAANIHDLLAHNFFLNDGFMGEFAKEKISNVIANLTFALNEKELKRLSEIPENDMIKHKRLKKEALISENEYLIDKYEKIEPNQLEDLIQLIGEKALRNKLKEMINDTKS